MNSSVHVGLGIVLALLVSPGATAAEKWADPKLPVEPGLQLWLDGSRAMGDQLRPFDGKLSAWRDASGKKRDVQQATVDAQPLLLPAGPVSIVRFDGVDDHLRATKQQVGLRSFTMFMVAAPRRNTGLFRAFLALNAANERDYESGLTVDLGPAATADFSTLNVEGRGFGGAQSLRTAAQPHRHLHTLEIVSELATDSISLTVDGQLEGKRARQPASISMDEITIGARYYNNAAGPQHVEGFGPCDVAEVLIYDRALDDDQRAAVRKYLSEKYAAARDNLPPDSAADGEVLETVTDAPPVQVFWPGFEVRQLPVELTNINNVKYRPDGSLVALGYDGRIWILRDTNGDGCEDRAELFWDNRSGLRAPIGMDLTPVGYERGDGVFVVGKTRCVLIVDTDKDGKADQEIEVAGGWKESFHSVDGLGVAFDPKDGSVYFGRGTYNFADPFLRDKEGRSHYSVRDEASAILRVSPDFKTREIIATGIRFPVALRFNRLGDLFATDQEGATWVPNGNPFDELLHVQRGRHYGFPARHPRDLPDVIDEPSTFDYGPQHQSTCGLNFNEPVRAGGPVFGPATWTGDAIVTGYSRGKLYRTQLVKTDAGYVARNHLVGSLPMLTVDAAVAPDGGLVVACHSGGPDWGSGPTGAGKLFRIQYVDPHHPQPALIWPTGPQELRIEFDRPVDPALLREVQSRSKLTGGSFVRAGDRFEAIAPGYAVVLLQKNAPRRDVPIRSVQLTPDRRSLVLAVDRLPGAVSYALTLPGMGRPEAEDIPKGILPQHAAIDLDFDLTGCEAIWTGANGEVAWRGWLPHLDLAVARAWTVGSVSHDALWSAMLSPGELTLRTQLDLMDMLRPAVQPGSRIDYELPKETVTVALATSGANLQIVSPKGDPRTSLTVKPEPGQLVPVEIRLRVDAAAQPDSPVALNVSWNTAEDSRPRPLPLRRMLVPWTHLVKDAGGEQVSVRPPELAGGSWSRGRQEFFGQQAACSKCHPIHGQGGSIGPDLSNLVHRDYVSVLRDITNPSFAINPDHLTYAVVVQDGRTLSGVVRTVGDKLLVGDNKGTITEVPRSEVEELKAQPISTMPEGVPKLLGPDRMRDLLTFLLTPPPAMPRDYPGPRPKPRSVAEVQAVLAGTPQPPELIRRMRIVLVAGPKDHGPGEHDYPAWQKVWTELLSVADQVDVETAWEWPNHKQLAKADVLVFYQHGDFNDQRASDLDAYLKRGGGAVYVHWAIDGRALGRQMAERTGLAALGAVGFRHGAMTLEFNRDVNHPVTRNFQMLDLVDETYWKMVGALPKNRLLATAIEENEPQPQLWSLERGMGRVFVSIPGHYSWTFDDPLFRVLLLRAIAWSAHEPVDRFNDLVWPGATIAR